MRWLLELLHRLFSPRYVDTGGSGAARGGPVVRGAGPWVRPRPIPPRPAPPAACPEHPSAVARADVAFDPSLPYQETVDGLLLQRVAVEILLADGRASRLGVLACFDPATREPRRISYIPLHEAVPATEVVP